MDEKGTIIYNNSPVYQGTAKNNAFDFDAQNETGIIGRTQIQNAAIGSAQIEDLAVTNAKIGDLAVTNAKIGDFSFNKGTGGTLTLGGTANGNGVLNIRDETGNLIILGDKEGHTYYDDSGNALVNIDELGFHAYNTAGSLAYEIKDGGFFSYGNSLNVIRLRENSGTTNSYGRLGYFGTASDFYFYINGGDSKGIYIDTDEKAYLNSGSIVGILADDDIVMLAAIDVNVSANGGNVYLSGSASSDYYFWNPDDEVYYSLDMTGNKSAIMPTTKGYRSLYCMESPEQWFMDFVDKKDQLDPLFEEVTEPPYRYIKCDDGKYQVWGKRRGKANDRFEEMTQDQFLSNNEFWRSAYSVRSKGSPVESKPGNKKINRKIKKVKIIDIKDKDGNLKKVPKVFYVAE